MSEQEQTNGNKTKTNGIHQYAAAAVVYRCMIHRNKAKASDVQLYANATVNSRGCVDLDTTSFRLVSILFTLVFIGRLLTST